MATGTKPKATTPKAVINYVPVFTLEAGVTGLKDAQLNDVHNAQLHGIYVADATHAEIGKKLYTGRNGIFYPDDLDIKVKAYSAAANPPPPSNDEANDEVAEEKPKKKGKKKNKKAD